VNLDSAAYYELLQAYIREHSGVWNEEIGEAAPRPSATDDGATIQTTASRPMRTAERLRRARAREQLLVREGLHPTDAQDLMLAASRARPRCDT
jgi:hypothetical protein